jgi:hypothetical protein
MGQGNGQTQHPNRMATEDIACFNQMEKGN